MSTEQIRGAIEELRDQLSLDYADGKYLNIVSSNLGVTRPPFGFDDDHWRAVVKVCAIQYKQIITKFHKLLEILCGPKGPRGTALKAPARAGDSSIFVYRPEVLPQVGHIYIDENKVVAEDLDYSYIDYTTGEVFLDGNLTYDHAKLVNDDFANVVDIPITTELSAGTSYVQLSEAFNLDPLPADVIPLLLTDNSSQAFEIIGYAVANHTTAFFSSLPLYSYAGARISNVNTTLANDYQSGSPYVEVVDASQFPDSGLVKITGTTTVYAAYTSVDRDRNFITMFEPSTGVLPAGSFVELMQPVGTASLGQCYVRGSYWDVYQSTPGEITVYLPETLKDVNTLQTASYLHPAYLGVTPSTTTVGSHTGTLVLNVASTASFPKAGAILVGGTRKFGFVVTSSTQFALSNYVVGTIAAGATVTLIQTNHVGTDLQDGNVWTVDDAWAGPYLYSLPSDAPATTAAYLNQTLAGPVRLMLDQDSSRSVLEVETVADLPTVFPYTAALGSGFPTYEEVEVIAHYKKQNTSTTTLSAGVTAGDSTITLSGPAVLPEAGGFRLIIDNTQVVFVDSYDAGTGVATLLQPSTSTHLAGVSVRLMADLVEVSGLGDYHSGLSPLSSRYTKFPPTNTTVAQTLSVMYSRVLLSSTSGFEIPDGKALLNFGKNRFTVEQTQAVAPTSTLLTLSDSSEFPVYYPYTVVIGPGTYNEETVVVTNNNIGTGELTILASFKTHTQSETVKCVLGDSTHLSYNTITGNYLEFDTPITVPYTHKISEPVRPTTTSSSPRSNGFDFPLRMPMDLVARIRTVFDYLRAAGVKIVFTYSRGN